MTSKIYFCDSCTRYTLKKNCPQCQAATHQAKPPKYSPEDKYGVYRRKAKEEAAKDRD